MMESDNREGLLEVGMVRRRTIVIYSISTQQSVSSATQMQRCMNDRQSMLIMLLNSPVAMQDTA